MKRIEYILLGLAIVAIYISAIAKINGVFPTVSKTYRVTNVLPEPEDSVEQTVIEVLDGDTIVLASGKHVRYVGMNAPEIAHEKKKAECFGNEATAANAALVLGKKVRLEQDISNIDKYGRLLRYVYIGNTLVNAKLVTDGYAYLKVFPPDVQKVSEIQAAENIARQKHIGVWSACE